MGGVTVPAYDLTRLLDAAPGEPWLAVRYVAETGSTNADLLGAPTGPTGEVLVTDHQRAGRGRLGRIWTAPPGSSLLVSVRLRPTLPPGRRGWLPMVAGLALLEAVRPYAGAVPVGLKWPNDLLVGDRKAAGILVQSAGDVVIIGVGCNVSLAAAELPVPTATSLLASGIEVDRVDLLTAYLTRLGRLATELEVHAGDAEAAGVAAAYRAACATVGHQVRVELATGSITGQAVDIDANGALVVATVGGEQTVHAGDALHLRPAT